MQKTLSFFIFFILQAFAYHPSFLSEDEMDHVRAERRPVGGDLPPAAPIGSSWNAPNAQPGSSASQPCDEDTLMNFLAEIQIINPESIVSYATDEHAVPACKELDENINKIKNYLNGCVPPSQPDLYYQLIKGVETLYTKLCTNSDFKKKFQGIYGCLFELRNDFHDCEGPADWNENSDDELVCKSYKAIADCYYVKAAKVCGQEAADMVKELVETIIDSILTINCSEVRKNPPVDNPMPAAYIKKQNQANKITSSRAVCTITFLGMLIKLQY